MHRPAILFLDEPTAGLDPQSRIALWEILGELHTDGQTILLTTHYMEEADQLCDRLAILDHGKLLALGTPAELKNTTGADTVVTVTARRRPRRARSPAPRRRRPASSASIASTRKLLLIVPRRQRHRARGVQRRRAQRLRRHRRVGDRAHARDRLHQPHREGPARMTAVTAHRRPCCRAPSSSAPPRAAASRGRVRARCCCATSTVLRKTLKEFIPRTLLQPFLLVFVFTYVFPKIGQGVGGGSAGGESEFSTLLVAGVVGPHDHVPGHPVGRAADGAGVRVHAGDRRPRARRRCRSRWSRSRRPCRARSSGLFAALIVFPIAAVVPATAGAPPRQLAGAAHA